MAVWSASAAFLTIFFHRPTQICQRTVSVRPLSQHPCEVCKARVPWTRGALRHRVWSFVESCHRATIAKTNDDQKNTRFLATHCPSHNWLRIFHFMKIKSPTPDLLSFDKFFRRKDDKYNNKHSMLPTANSLRQMQWKWSVLLHKLFAELTNCSLINDTCCSADAIIK